MKKSLASLWVIIVLFVFMSNISIVQAKELEFIVVDKSESTPLANVELEIRINDDQTTAKTDEDGKYLVELPDQELMGVSITTKYPGYVPMRVTWSNHDSKMVIPDYYLLELEKGTSIGGIIQDEDGKPIEFARVYLLVPGEDPVERCAIYNYEVLTDSAGKWHCDIMPSELNEVWVKLGHDQYISDSMYGQSYHPEIAELRTMAGVMVMKRGITVQGYVKDKQGKPITGAEVAQGSDRNGSDYPLAKTDDKGYYRFYNCPEGPMVLTVNVPDGMGSGRNCTPDNNPTPLAKKGIFYAPDLREINVSKTLGSVDFVLDKGQTLEGRIFDKNGNPLKDIPISADTWRGHRSISWYGKTNTEGRFVWKSAPADKVMFDIYPAEYMSVRQEPMTAGEKEYSITMYPKLEVHVTITDAVTGEKIVDARLSRGIVWSKGSATHWEDRREEIMAVDGSYIAFYDYPRYGHKLLAQADGYLPQESRVFKDDEGSIEINFKLEKGENVQATFLLPNGQPAEGVEVAIALTGNVISISGGKLRNSRGTIYTSGKDGKVKIPPQINDYSIAALHEEGYAVVSKAELEKDKTITLKKWAVVTGKLLFGSKPGANETINIYMNRDNRDNVGPKVYFNGSPKTDQDGNFQDKYLPEGTAQIGVQVKISDNAYISNNMVKVELQPGVETKVTLGGSGRQVKGRFVLPPDSKEDISFANGGELIIAFEEPEPDYPEGYSDWEHGKKRDFFENWRKSEEYKRLMSDRKGKPVRYSSRIEADGSFVINDVIEGKYELSLYLKGAKINEYINDTVLRYSKTFTIEPMEGGRSDEAMDLGDMEIVSVKNQPQPVPAQLDSFSPSAIGSGEAAPEFVAKELDGKELKLSDLAGKYVLLDFWATWCGPCRGEEPYLKAVWAKYKDNEKFTMLSFSFDDSVDTVKKHIEENEIEWPQCIDLAGFQSAAGKAYGIKGIPSIFLIDPDGKVVAKDIRGDDIIKAIDKYLAK